MSDHDIEWQKEANDKWVDKLIKDYEDQDSQCCGNGCGDNCKG